MQRTTGVSCFSNHNLNGPPTEVLTINVYYFSCFTAFKSQRLKDPPQKR